MTFDKARYNLLKHNLLWVKIFRLLFFATFTIFKVEMYRKIKMFENTNG